MGWNALSKLDFSMLDLNVGQDPPAKIQAEY